MKNKLGRFFYLITILLNAFYLNSQVPEYRIIVFDFGTTGNNITIEEGQIVANSIRVATSKFSKDSDVEILEREDMIDLFMDRESAEKLPEIFDKNTAIKIGKLLEANYVIFGEVVSSSLFEGFSISGRIVDIEKGTILTAEEKRFVDPKEYDRTIYNITKELLSVTPLIISDQSYFISNENLIRLKQIIGQYGEANKYCNMVYPDELGNLSIDLKNISKLNPNSPIFGIVSSYNPMSEWNHGSSHKPFRNGSKFIIVFNSQGMFYKIQYGYKYNEVSNGIYWNDLKECEVKKIISESQTPSNYIVVKKVGGGIPDPIGQGDVLYKNKYIHLGICEEEIVIENEYCEVMDLLYNMLNQFIVILKS